MRFLEKSRKNIAQIDSIESSFLGFREVHRTLNGAPTHWIVFDYKVLLDPSQVRNGEPEKIDDIEWFTLEQLPSPMHSQVPSTIQRYKHLL